MSKAVKVILIVAASCMACGIVMAGIGLAWGGFTRSYSIFWQDGLRVVTPASYRMQDFSQAFERSERLTIRADACTLQFVQDSKYSVSGHYDPTFWDLDIDQTSEGIQVKLTPKSNYLGNVNFGIIGAHDNATANLVIGYPDKAPPDSIDITTNAASLDLTSIVGNSVSLSSNAASVHVGQLDCQHLSLSMNAGSMDFNNLNASKSASIDLNAGSFEAKNSALSNLDFDMKAGSSRIQGILLGDNYVHVSAGSADFDLAQPKSNLNITGTANAGSLTINGLRPRESDNNANQGPNAGLTNVTATVNMGSVDIMTR
ncbi:MAG: DUF4097 domain-containing protein [Actinomycetia bacterium]|nr:DUF4097 domain-containing protein [Actinomycetes bacterium]